VLWSAALGSAGGATGAGSLAGAEGDGITTGAEASVAAGRGADPVGRVPLHVMLVVEPAGTFLYLRRGELSGSSSLMNGMWWFGNGTL
jgi:hypothetical protein